MIERKSNKELVKEYIRRTKTPVADMSAEEFQGSRPGYVFNYGPKRRRRKKISTFNIIVFLCVFAVALVLYISNIIAVNNLMKENDRLGREYEQIRNRNEILRAELNNRSGLEYIGFTASERMGLVNPADPPRWITIDKNEVERLQRELKKYEWK